MKIEGRQLSRSGGSAEKLGNTYEGLWTLRQVLRVLTGDVRAITLEAIGQEESRGVEFHTILLDGSRSYHSVKRQHFKGEWTLSRLLSLENGRSVLGDLFAHLEREKTARAVFVSGSSATDLKSLCSRATHTDGLREFRRDLDQSHRLRNEADGRLLALPLLRGDWGRLYEFLQRLEIVTIDEDTLRGEVEDHLHSLCYHESDRDWQAETARVLVADFMLRRLGMTTTAQEVWAFLGEHGYHYAEWSRDARVQQRVRDLTADFQTQVEFELINREQMPRTVVPQIVEAVRRDDGPRVVLLVGSGSAGKSCVLAQVVRKLQSEGVPLLPVRMDRCGDMASTRELGRKLGDFRESPAIVLAGLSNQQRAVLVVDQLDAVSQMSGRQPALFDVFDRLRREVQNHGFLRMIVACRTFDVENDHRLRLLGRSKSVLKISLEPLTDQEIDTALTAAGQKPTQLNARQRQILRIPLHLFLYLDVLKDGPLPFSRETELFERYWTRKERRVRDLGHQEWTYVIDRMCDFLSEHNTLCAPVAELDGYAGARDAMLSEHVLVQTGRQISFFHERFYDYVFARRFETRGGRLPEYLLADEQTLERRTTVRQIVQEMRASGSANYLPSLQFLLTDERVRFHIKAMILSWVALQDDPREEEWRLFSELLFPARPKSWWAKCRQWVVHQYKRWRYGPPVEWPRHICPVIDGQVPWFDLLNRLGVWAEWLRHEDPQWTDQTLWMLGRTTIREHRSGELAALLEPYAQVDNWLPRFRQFFRFGGAYHSDKMRELFLRLLADGRLDGENDQELWWDMIDGDVKHAPEFVTDCLAIWLKRRIAGGADERGQILSPHEHNEFAKRVILGVAEGSPRYFVQTLWPHCERLVALTAVADDQRHRDQSFSWRSYGFGHDPAAILLTALTNALQYLAQNHPEFVDEFV